MKKVWKQLSPTMRVTLSRHGHKPILERLNPCYGYYATVRALTQDDYAHYMSDTWAEYDGPKHEAQVRFEAQSHLC